MIFGFDKVYLKLPCYLLIYFQCGEDAKMNHQISHLKTKDPTLKSFKIVFNYYHLSCRLKMSLLAQDTDIQSNLDIVT